MIDSTTSRVLRAVWCVSAASPRLGDHIVASQPCMRSGPPVLTEAIGLGCAPAAHPSTTSRHAGGDDPVESII